MSATLALLAAQIATLVHNAAVFSGDGRDREATTALLDAGEHLDAMMTLIHSKPLDEDAI